MDIVLFERSEKGGMEHGVDLPLFWKFQSVCEGPKYLGNIERSFLFWSSLFILILQLQVL